MRFGALRGEKLIASPPGAGSAPRPCCTAASDPTFRSRSHGRAVTMRRAAFRRSTRFNGGGHVKRTFYMAAAHSRRSGVPDRVGDACQWSDRRRATNSEWRSYGGEPRQLTVLAARSDQRAQLQEPRDRVAVQDREPRPAAGDSVRIDAADGERASCTRPPARGGRSSRSIAATGEHAVDAQRERRAARRQRAAAAVRPRPRLLDRRPRRADSLRHARLSARRARRQDRHPDPGLRQGRRRRSEAWTTIRRSISSPAKSDCTRRR